jgi:hypothetical protein
MIELHLRFAWTMESILIFFPKLLVYDLVSLKICSCIKFCQIFVIMWNFAKFMEVCEVLRKLRIFIYLFPNLWNYVKFGQKLEAQGLGFRVFPPKLGFFLGVWSDLLPHFQGFWSQWCNKILLKHHHLKDMGGVKFQGSRIDEGTKG